MLLFPEPEEFNKQERTQANKCNPKGYNMNVANFPDFNQEAEFFDERAHKQSGLIDETVPV
jgi:hypothetical protein